MNNKYNDNKVIKDKIFDNGDYIQRPNPYKIRCAKCEKIIAMIPYDHGCCSKETVCYQCWQISKLKE